MVLPYQLLPRERKIKHSERIWKNKCLELREIKNLGEQGSKMRSDDSKGIVGRKRIKNGEAKRGQMFASPILRRICREELRNGVLKLINAVLEGFNVGKEIRGRVLLKDFVVLLENRKRRFEFTIQGI